MSTHFKSAEFYEKKKKICKLFDKVKGFFSGSNFLYTIQYNFFIMIKHLFQNYRVQSYVKHHHYM